MVIKEFLFTSLALTTGLIFYTFIIFLVYYIFFSSSDENSVSSEDEIKDIEDTSEQGVKEENEDFENMLEDV